jgi:hypothetical protein
MKTIAFLLDANRELLPDLVLPWQMCGTAVVTCICCYLMKRQRCLRRISAGIAALWAVGIVLQVIRVMWRFDLRESWTHGKHAAAIFTAGFPLLAVTIFRFFPGNEPNKAPEPTTTAVTPPAAQESRRP